MQETQCGAFISPSDQSTKNPSFNQWCWLARRCCWFQQNHNRLHFSLRVLFQPASECDPRVSSYVGFLRLGRAVNHGRGSVRGGTRRQGGDCAAGFPRTALITEPTSDFVPRWQMVGWGGIQGGRFTSIVRAHKLHKETIVSAKGKKEQGWGKKSFQNQTNSRGN